MSDDPITEALATIKAVLPPEVNAQQVQERIVNLAASGNALAIDLGALESNIPQEVPGEELTEEQQAQQEAIKEQREATKNQVVIIANEINRLSTLLESN